MSLCRLFIGEIVFSACASVCLANFSIFDLISWQQSRLAYGGRCRAVAGPCSSLGIPWMYSLVLMFKLTALALSHGANGELLLLRVAFKSRNNIVLFILWDSWSMNNFLYISWLVALSAYRKRKKKKGTVICRACCVIYGFVNSFNLEFLNMINKKFRFMRSRERQSRWGS